MAQRLEGRKNVEYLAAPSTKKSFLRSWWPAHRLTRKARPDVLVTYNWGSAGWWLSKLISPNLPHIHIEDGFGPDEGANQHFRRILFRRLLLRNRLTHTVLPSRTLFKIASTCWGIPAKNMSFIPNGVDSTRFRMDRVGPKAGPLTIGTVATLRREKNIMRLIDLFGEVHRTLSSTPLQLLIVGDGPESAALRAHARQSKSANAIVFAGATVAPEVHLRRMDIFAMTSDTEQMPLSVLEAMASGLPVVSFAVGDVPNMVSSENKTFASIDAVDNDGFVRRMTQLITSSDLRMEIGRRNASHIDSTFTLAEMARSYAILFDRTSNESGIDGNAISGADSGPA